MTTSIQISASISREMKGLLEAYVRKRGVKKSFVIEQALRQYFLAAESVPEEFHLSPVVRVSAASLKQVATLIGKAPPATPAMRKLMASSWRSCSVDVEERHWTRQVGGQLRCHPRA
jgi:hypothetical protein